MGSWGWASLFDVLKGSTTEVVPGDSTSPGSGVIWPCLPYLSEFGQEGMVISDNIYLLPECLCARKKQCLNFSEPQLENVSAVPNRLSSNAGKGWGKMLFH